MAGANSNIQMTDLDFNNIKNNLKKYLQGQDTLKDYNYEGAALSNLLDILSYNTQYNAYYLNMVANEMFLDSAIQRSSVISQAKVLNYTPKSAIAPTASLNLTLSGITDASLTLPKFTNFLSEAIDGINYNFVTTDSQTVNTSGGIASFLDVNIKQGIPTSLSFNVDSTVNPSFTFEIPETNIDTTSLSVLVQESTSNSASQVYNLASNFLTLNSTSTVYFLQESLKGTYEVIFGDGVLGKQLNDGNVIKLSYVVTQGSSSAGANNFVLMDPIAGYSNYVLYPLTSASQGGDKESIASIKFQAPKSFAAQNRAVSKNDYITAIQQNNLNFTFDAVNVWGGEEHTPPVYGQVFVSLKPTGSYNLTETQKQKIVTDILKPISVMTVTPTIIDPDYTYIKLDVTLQYNPNKTSLTSAQIESNVKTAIQNFGTSTLNTFNSSFNSYELLRTIQSVDSSIISSDYDVYLQKKFYPNLTNSTTYNLYYDAPIEKYSLVSGIGNYPAMQFLDPTDLTTIVDGIYLEEIPTSTYGVESINIINPGFNYALTPTITILGDGTGATAHAVVVNGSIRSIVVDTAGVGYTSAIATVTPANGDTTGQLGSLVVVIAGQYGTLRSYYNNSKNVKTVFKSNIGIVDYINGIITLENFNPVQIDNSLGQLTVYVKPTTTLLSSTYNRIITIDPYDATAITVKIIAKSE